MRLEYAFFRGLCVTRISFWIWQLVLEDPEQRANFKIDGKDDNGKTPLEIAYDMGRTKLFNLLREEGARTDLPFSTGVYLKDAIKAELQTGMRTLDELSHHQGQQVGGIGRYLALFP